MDPFSIVMAASLGSLWWMWRIPHRPEQTAPIRLPRRPRAEIPLLAATEAPHGREVVLNGRVRAGELLQAPLTGRPCVGWQVKVTFLGHGLKVYKQQVNDFWIDDVLVESSHVHLCLDADKRQQTGIFRPASPEVRAFCDEHGIGSDGWSDRRFIRLVEGVLEEGEQVAVAGTAKWVAKATGSYREVAQQLHVTPLAEGRVLCTDISELLARDLGEHEVRSHFR